MSDDSAIVYEAFISYRHTPTDTVVARRIQRALEGFRVPRPLRSGGRRALGRCFRDADELPAGASLSNEIRSALGSSRFLIVVCSPDTPESSWVNLEIEEFIVRRGIDHVLVALAGGEPHESFPAALRSHGEKGYEPLAADFRPGRGRRELRREKLRLAAALIGCGLDDLVNRRRARVLQIGAAAACGAAVVGGVIAYQANRLHEAQVARFEEQSNQLADQSGTLLSRGMRMEAIQLAAAALPQTGDATDRPLVPAALYALTEALDLYPSSSSLGLPQSRARYSYGISGSVGNLTVSEDDTWFAAVLDDGSTGVFDTLSGRHLATIETGAATCPVAVGDMLVLIQGDSCAGYDHLSGSPRWTLRGEGRDYLSVTSLGGGRVVVATREQDGRVSLTSVDASTGEVLRETSPAEAGSGILRLLVSADGSRSAALLTSGVTIADLATGEHKSVRCDFSAFSAAMDARTLYVTGVRAEDAGVRTVVCAYDLETARELWAIELPRDSAPSGYADSPRLFQTGGALNLADGTSLRQLDASTGAVTLELTTMAVARLDVVASRDGAMLDVLFQAGLGQLTDLSSPSAGRAQFSLVVPGRIYASELIMLDGASYELASYDDGGSTRVGLFPVLRSMSSYPGAAPLAEGHGLSSIPARSADGSAVAYCSSEPGKVVVCDFSEPEGPTCHLVDVGMSSPISTQFLFLPDLPDSVFVCDLGTSGVPVAITKVDVRTGSVEGTWASQFEPQTLGSLVPLRIVSAEEDSVIVTGGDGVFVEVVDGRTLSTTDVLGVPQPLPPAATSADVQVYLARAAWEVRGEYLYYDSIHGFERSGDGGLGAADDGITAYDLADPTDPYSCLLVSPDESRMFVACSDGATRCFSADDGSLLWEYAPGYSSRPMAVSPDGSLLVVRCDRERLSLVDVGSGTPHGQTEGGLDMVVSVAFSDGGNSVTALSVSTDPSAPQPLLLTRYDVSVQGLQRLCSVSQGVCSVGVDSRILIIAQESGELAPYTLPLYTRAELLDLAEEVTRGHELTPEERRLYHID